MFGSVKEKNRTEYVNEELTPTPQWDDRTKYINSHMNVFKRMLDPMFNFSGRLGDDYDRIYEERDYNDYQSQVERMQAAGLNPDLNGVSGYESDTANDTQEAAANQDALIGNAVSMIGNAFASAVGLYTQIASFQDSRVLSDISAFNELTGGIDKVLGSFSGAVAADADAYGISADEIASKGRGAGLDAGLSIEDMMNDARKNLLDRYAPVFRSKRAKRMFEGRLNWYMNDAKSLDDVVTAVSSLAQKKSDLLQSTGDLKANREIGTDGLKEMNKLYLRLLEESNKNQYKYQRNYGLLGGPENAAMYDVDNAALHNQALGFDVASKSFNKVVQEETLKTCKNLMKHDDMFSHFLASQLLRGAISVGDIANVGSSFVAPFGGALGKAAGKAASKALGF